MINRRDFLKLSGAGLAVFLVGCSDKKTLPIPVVSTAIKDISPAPEYIEPREAWDNWFEQWKDEVGPYTTFSLEKARWEEYFSRDTQYGDLKYDVIAYFMEEFADNIDNPLKKRVEGESIERYYPMGSGIYLNENKDMLVGIAPTKKERDDAADMTRLGFKCVKNNIDNVHGRMTLLAGEKANLDIDTGFPIGGKGYFGVFKADGNGGYKLTQVLSMDPTKCEERK